jgi:hypothetical protein
VQTHNDRALTGRSPAHVHATTSTETPHDLVDQQNRYWRVERVGPRWQLSLYRPAVEAWQRVGSWPSRGEAIQAAADQDESW